MTATGVNTIPNLRLNTDTDMQATSQILSLILWQLDHCKQ